MKRYLVTGGCGFIGSHLVQELTELGHHVVVVDDFSTGKKDNIDDYSNITLYEDDICNTAIAQEAMRDVDGCFHLAAIASVERSNNEWHYAHQVNQSAFVGLLEAAKSNKVPIVYASSAAVYGSNQQLPLKESSPTQPLTAYGADKFGCEMHARVAHNVHAIPTIGLRFFNVYGPNQDASSPYSGVITIFIRQMINNENINIYGTGEETRDFVFVKDVVSALILAMDNLQVNPTQHSGAVYNVGTGIQTSILELANIIQKMVANECERNFLPGRRGNICHSLASIDAIKKALSFQPHFQIVDGLHHTVNHYKEGS